MSDTIRNLLVKAGADLSALQKDFKTAAKNLKSIGKELTSTGEALTKGLTLPILAVAGASVKMASDMQETTNKVSEIFEENASVIENWSKDSIKSMGLAQQTAMESAALFGDMGKGMQIPTKAGLEMSTSLTQLSADMASFKNVSQERVQQALTGVYTGETEALKGLGIVMTEANLKQFALSKGITKSIDDMTQAEKVQLRYAYVMSVTSDAQGDFERTGGGAANQARMLKEQLKQAGVDIGNILLPAATDLIKSLNGIIKSFQDLSPETKQTIITVALVAAAIGPVITIIGKLFTTLSGLTKGVGLAIKALSAEQGLLGALKSLAGGPAGLIVAGIVAITAVVTTLVLVFNEANKEAIKINDEINKLKDECAQSAKAFEEQTKEINANVDAEKKLTEELYKLADKENKTNAEKARMKQMVSQLNSMIPNLNLAIDETTGSLNAEKGAIDGVIAAKEAEIKLTAYEERLTELYREQARLMQEREAAQLRYNDAQNTATANSNASYTQLMNQGVALGTARDQLNSVSTAWGENEARIKSAEAAYAEMSTGITTGNGQIASSNAQLAISNEESAAAQQEYITAVESAYNTHMSNMGSIFDKGIQMRKGDTDDIIKNLRKQIDQFTGWQSNIKTLSGKVPSDVMAELIKLGPGAAPLIADLTKQGDPKLQEFITLMQEKSKAAKDAAITEVGGLPGEVTTVVNNVNGELQKTTEIKNSAIKLGEAISSGLEKGINNGASSLYARARSIARQVINEMKSVIQPGSPSKVTTVFGRAISDGLALGIGQHSKNALREAALLASNTIGSFGNMKLNASGFQTSPAFRDSAFSQALAAGGQTNNNQRSVNVNIDARDTGLKSTETQKIVWQIEREIKAAL
jgi:hypothetical protein